MKASEIVFLDIMKKPKIDYDKMSDDFDYIYLMSISTMPEFIRKAVNEKDNSFISKYGQNILKRYKRLDGFVSRSNDEELQKWYSEKTRFMAPVISDYLDDVKKSIEFVNYDGQFLKKEYEKLAKIFALKSFDITTLLIKTFEDTLRTAGLNLE